MTGLWTWLQQLPVIAGVRNGAIVYPAVLSAHLLGLAMTFGATVVTAARLLPAHEGSRSTLIVSTRVSVAGFALAVVTGAVLFAVDAADYASNTALQVKLILITLAVINALAYHHVARRTPETRTIPAPFRRLVGCTAIAFWTAVIVAGRWIAF